METQTTATNWLEVESESLNTPMGERLPSLKFPEENVIYEFDVDFSKQFPKYTDTAHGNKTVIKAIIPVTQSEAGVVVKKNFWLNKANPAFKILIDAGKKGQTHFKVMRTGTQANTRYVFVK